MKDLLKKKKEQLFLQKGLLWILSTTPFTRQKMGQE